MEERDKTSLVVMLSVVEEWRADLDDHCGRCCWKALHGSIEERRVDRRRRFIMVVVAFAFGLLWAFG